MFNQEIALKIIEARNAIALAWRLVDEIRAETPRRARLTNAWYQLKDAQTNLVKFAEENAREM